MLFGKLTATTNNVTKRYGFEGHLQVSAYKQFKQSKQKKTTKQRKIMLQNNHYVKINKNKKREKKILKEKITKNYIQTWKTIYQ